MSNNNDNSYMNKAKKDGNNALHLASQEGRLKEVKLLMEKGIDINQTGQYGKTRLHDASESGNKELVEFLIFCKFCRSII